MIRIAKIRKYLDGLLMKDEPDLFTICGAYLLIPTVIVAVILEMTTGTMPPWLGYVVAAPFIYVIAASIYCTVSKRGYLMSFDDASSARKIIDLTKKSPREPYTTASVLCALRDRVGDKIWKEAIEITERREAGQRDGER